MYLSIIVLGVVCLFVLFKVVNKKPKSEFTEWQWHRDLMPVITKLPNGEKLFQHQEILMRYNYVTQTWESKTVLDPIKRPLNEMNKWTDSHALLYKN